MAALLAQRAPRLRRTRRALRLHPRQPVPPPRDLVERTHQFALSALRFYRRLPKTPEAQTPGRQFLDAALSVAANYRAARRGRSRAEFVSKLGICLEEADECVGWLELMRDGQIAIDSDLLAEARELSAILTTSQKTARANTAKMRDNTSSKYKGQGSK